MLRKFINYLISQAKKDNNLYIIKLITNILICLVVLMATLLFILGIINIVVIFLIKAYYGF